MFTTASLPEESVSGDGIDDGTSAHDDGGINATSVTIAVPTRPSPTTSPSTSVTADDVFIKTDRKWLDSDDVDYDNWLRYVAADVSTLADTGPAAHQLNSNDDSELRSRPQGFSADDDDDDDVTGSGNLNEGDDIEEEQHERDSAKQKSSSVTTTPGRRHDTSKRPKVSAGRKSAQRHTDVTANAGESSGGFSKSRHHPGIYGVASKDRRHHHNPQHQQQRSQSSSNDQGLDNIDGYQGDGGYYDDEEDDQASVDESTCDRLQCPEPARCVVESNAGGSGAVTSRCRCPLGAAGRYCERGKPSIYQLQSRLTAVELLYRI